MIERTLEEHISQRLFKGKAIVLTGPRQAGKTTLVRKIVRPHLEKSLILDGDDPVVIQLLNRPNTQQLKQITGRNRILLIDEAQRIPEIGLTAKIITDQFSDVQLILTGSSSFDLMEKTEEPLTGRKWSFVLFPVTWTEWQNYAGYVQAEQELEIRLIFGFYPDILMHPTDQQILLKELTVGYLYKDIFSYARIKKPEILQKLLQAIAWQIGNEVSYNELSSITGLDVKTVINYIDILEKAYVIFRLPTYSTNLRDEIKTNRKIYFYDNGVRNALLGLWQPVTQRSDIGALWENFLVSERKKYLAYINADAGQFFWRNKQQQEIDYVEVKNGQPTAYEFKWNEKRKYKFPSSFIAHYGAENTIINRSNFRTFLSQP